MQNETLKASDNIFGMDADADDLGTEEAMGQVRSAMLMVTPEGQERAVVVINAQSMIQIVNQVGP